jgi:hypothetical protein
MCQHCHSGVTASVWGVLDAVPGPSVALGGAAAIGVTILPPLTPVVPAEEPMEPCLEVGALPAVLQLLPPAVTLGALLLSSIA